MRLTRKDSQALLREVHQLAVEHNISLTDWESKFIESVKYQSTLYDTLTEKQSDVLQGIYRKVSEKAI